MPRKARKISKRPLATSQKLTLRAQACIFHTLSSSTRRIRASKAPEEPRSNNNTRSKNASKQKERGEKKAQEKCASSSTPGERAKRFSFFFSYSTSLSSFPVAFHFPSSEEEEEKPTRRPNPCCVYLKKKLPARVFFLSRAKKKGCLDF